MKIRRQHNKRAVAKSRIQSFGCLRMVDFLALRSNTTSEVARVRVRVHSKVMEEVSFSRGLPTICGKCQITVGTKALLDKLTEFYSNATCVIID